MSTTITDREWCIQHGGSVPKEQMTHVWANGVKRRMCEMCQDRYIERKKQERKRLIKNIK